MASIPYFQDKGIRLRAAATTDPKVNDASNQIDRLAPLSPSTMMLHHLWSALIDSLEPERPAANTPLLEPRDFTNCIQHCVQSCFPMIL